MLHEEVLTPASKNLFAGLSAFRDDFYLAGGTALALQIGHRISIDFDLFSAAPIKKTLLQRVEQYTGTPLEILVNNSRELTVIGGGVKHTFLHYPFPVILPFAVQKPVNLLSPKEILATKAYTIGRRGVFKDYLDLYFGLRGTIGSLTDVMDIARQKYAEAFNDRLFLEQLLYMEDVSDDAVVLLAGETPTKSAIVDFFSSEIQKISL